MVNFDGSNSGPKATAAWESSADGGIPLEWRQVPIAHIRMHPTPDIVRVEIQAADSTFRNRTNVFVLNGMLKWANKLPLMCSIIVLRLHFFIVCPHLCFCSCFNYSITIQHQGYPIYNKWSLLQCPSNIPAEVCPCPVHSTSASSGSPTLQMMPHKPLSISIIKIRVLIQILCIFCQNLQVSKHKL